MLDKKSAIAMNCIINEIINWAGKKGTRTEVVRRYLMMKYRMNVDPQALERRINRRSDKEIRLA
ncbi:MAG: hypothetical protein ACNS60_02390 [Candidatus Cyclobacteriaceae bacterium M2_1C_046]